MPCYQPSSLPSGVTTTGRTSYATEADCLNACKEGACCDGTSCSVKPQCQCKCAAGSCCGPDTFTNQNGETGPKCRNETQSACEARGGVWRCGVNCIGLAGDANAGYPLGSGICTSLTSSTPSPVFKGVGTVCSPNPCPCCNSDGTPKQGSGCEWCWCFCGEGAAVYPRFVNVSVSLEYKLSRGIGGVQTKTFTTSLTLSLTSQANRNSCPVWKYGEIGGYFIPVNQFVVGSFLPFGNGIGAIHLTHQNTSPTSTQFSVALAFLDFSDQSSNQSERWHTGAGFTGSEYKDSYDTFASSSGVQTSGTCFSDITGASVSREMPIGTSSGTFPIVSGETNMKWTVSVVGVQQ